MTRTVRDAAARYVRLLGQRPFNVLVAAEQVSTAGDSITVLALPIFVVDSTGSPLLAGLALAARFLPWIFVGPLAAPWTDRSSRKAILVGCDLGRAALVGALALLGPGSAQAPLVLAISFAGGSLSAVQRAARSSVVPSVVSRDDYPTAVALQRTLLVSSAAVGSAAGGVLVAALGARTGFAVDALTFAISAALVATAALGAAAGRRAVHGGALEGWRQVFGHRPVAYALLTGTVAQLLNAGAPLLATRAQSALFGGDASLSGSLLAAVSAGTAAGAVVLGSSDRLRRSFHPATGPAAFVLAYAGVVAVPRFELALVAWFLAGAATGAQLVYLNVMTVRLVPNTVLGRAGAVINAVGYTGWTAGPYLTGVLEEHLGPRYAFGGLAAAGAVLLLAAVLARWPADPGRAAATRVPDGELEETATKEVIAMSRTMHNSRRPKPPRR